MTSVHKGVAIQLVPQLNFHTVIQQFYQASCFRVISSMLSSVNSMSTSPLPHFICCQISPLVRGNAVWNSLMSNKAFQKSKGDGFGRSITDRKGKSISREVSIPMKIKQHNRSSSV